MNNPAPISLLSDFLSEHPLYAQFGINQPAAASDLQGTEFNFFCESEREHHFFTLQLTSQTSTCAGEDNASSTRQKMQEQEPTAFIGIYEAVCQSCRNFQVTFAIKGGSQSESPRYFLQKIGQYPPPASQINRLPGELAGFLSPESRDAYSKGLKCLEIKFGRGALIYLNQVAEKEWPAVLDQVASEYSAYGWKVREAFQSYSEHRQKSTLIEKISLLLPTHIHRQVPALLVFLFDLVLEQAPPADEAACLQKSREADLVFRHLAKRLRLNQASSAH